MKKRLEGCRPGVPTPAPLTAPRPPHAKRSTAVAQPIATLVLLDYYYYLLLPTRSVRSLLGIILRLYNIIPYRCSGIISSRSCLTLDTLPLFVCTPLAFLWCSTYSSSIVCITRQHHIVYFVHHIEYSCDITAVNIMFHLSVCKQVQRYVVLFAGLCMFVVIHLLLWTFSAAVYVGAWRGLRRRKEGSDSGEGFVLAPLY